MISYITASMDDITSTAQPAVDSMHNIMIKTIILLDLVLVMMKQAQTVSGTIRTILGIRTSNADRATSGDVKATTLTRGLSLRRSRGVLPKHGSSKGSSQRGPLLWGLTPNSYPSNGGRWGGCRWNMWRWRRSIGGRRWRGRLNVADGRKCSPGTSQLLSKTNDQLVLSDHIASEVHCRPVALRVRWEKDLPGGRQSGVVGKTWVELHPDLMVTQVNKSLKGSIENSLLWGGSGSFLRGTRNTAIRGARE